MSQITVTLPDGSTKPIDAGAPVLAVAQAISPRLADAALAAKVDDRLVDLTYPLTHDARVEIVTNRSADALHLYRHSTAHLMAAAVTSLFPQAQCGIGPAIDEGFFYDFIVDRPFVPEDLERIEARMRELAAADYVFERQIWPRDEAMRFFAARGEPLKVQLIEEKTAGQPEVSCYTIKDRDMFVDFCVGPHVPSTGRLKAFKLLSTSNAYWKGDAKNAPMQRIYGTAFFSAEGARRAPAADRRSQKARPPEGRPGTRPVHVSPVGAGCHVLAAQGHGALQRARQLHARRAPARRLRRSQGAAGLQQGPVGGPGHWEHYRDNMFLVKSADGEDMSMKPMNCPGHYLIYGSEMRSYKDLPLRLHEQTPLHRNEASGVLSGLTRVRQFSQDDGHLFVTEEQIAAEVEALLGLVRRVYGDFGLAYTAKLSTRPEKFLGEIATWDHAEASLKQALERAGQAYTINAGDGAFYGPKIDFDITDAIGRKWQCATIQLDYNAPQRFDLKYIGADNTEHRPVVIHRAIFGSLERFVAILIEHFAGAFPLWMAPSRLGAADCRPSCRVCADRRARAGHGWPAGGSRCSTGEDQLQDSRAQLQKIPYMLVIGDREASDGAVAVRSRSRGDLGARAVSAFVADALAEVAQKTVS